MRFIGFEYLSESECYVVLRESAVGGAIDIDKWVVPLESLTDTPTSIESFLSLVNAGLLDWIKD